MAVKKWPSCQICGKPVSSNQGLITIYKKDLSAFEKSKKIWEGKHPKDEPYAAKDLAEFPCSVEWHWGHSKCLKEGMYEITYDRFDTVEKALSWTLHMMDKPWVDQTNWADMVRSHHKLSSV